MPTSSPASDSNPSPLGVPTSNVSQGPTVLVLGARGAVGRATVAELRRAGARVTAAGRTAPEPGGIAIDLSSAAGFSAVREVNGRFDVVINASGIEDARLPHAVTGAILVDISATASYLAAIAEASGDHGVVLGAGIAPGLSTILVNALDPTPESEIDVAVMLGGGETHGPAAVAWTANLAGRPLFQAGETYEVLNFRESLRILEPGGSRRYVRADFPDQFLVGRPTGALVRSWLATDSRLSTAALSVVGRFPTLSPLVARAPHLGGTGWSITAIDRSTRRSVRARGDGQSRSTGILTARAALAAAEQQLRRFATSADLLGLTDVADVADVAITDPASAVVEAA